MARKVRTGGKAIRRQKEREGEKVSGRAREGVSDRLSGCTGISNTQRHMILGSEVILTDEYRAGSRLPHKRKGVVFYSPSLESLFQESILPTQDCKPVSRQKSYVHKYYAFFSFFFTVLLACQNIYRRSFLIQMHLCV